MKPLATGFSLLRKSGLGRTSFSCVAAEAYSPTLPALKARS